MTNPSVENIRFARAVRAVRLAVEGELQAPVAQCVLLDAILYLNACDIEPAMSDVMRRAITRSLVLKAKENQDTINRARMVLDDVYGA